MDIYVVQKVDASKSSFNAAVSVKYHWKRLNLIYILSEIW